MTACWLAILLLLAPPAPASTLRVLVRGDGDRPVAGLTLTIASDSGAVRATTGPDGVAVAAGLGGSHATITGAALDGQALAVPAAPGERGLRLTLIPGAVRDALLRLDDDRLIADPDMIFSPGEPGEPTVAPLPTLAAIAASLPTLTPAVAPAAVPEQPESSQAGRRLGLACALVLAVALLAAGVALARASLRRRP